MPPLNPIVDVDKQSTFAKTTCTEVTSPASLLYKNRSFNHAKPI